MEKVQKAFLKNIFERRKSVRKNSKSMLYVYLYILLNSFTRCWAQKYKEIQHPSNDAVSDGGERLGLNLDIWKKNYITNLGNTETTDTWQLRSTSKDGKYWNFKM